MVGKHHGLLNVSSAAKVCRIKIIVDSSNIKKNLLFTIEFNYNISLRKYYRDMLSLPTVSLLGCFLILCHYIKLLDPVKNLENFKEHFISTNRGAASSPNFTTKISSNIPTKPFKGRRSPVPKPLSEVEIQNQDYGWIDWAWWTAFNFSLGK